MWQIGAFMLEGENTVFQSGASTHPGKVRSLNEDAYLVHPRSGLWAIADGMGGHDAGQLASSTIIETLRAIGPADSAADLLARCESGVVEANGALKRLATERGSAIVGATVAVLLTFEENYACVWSGDSRIYRIRDGTIAQLSRDHTEIQDLIETGLITAEEGRLSPRRNIVTRAIGVYDAPELEIEYGALAGDDIFVLCSDGLTAHVEDHEIYHCVVNRIAQEACNLLVELALERGGFDNITVIVVRYRPQPRAGSLAEAGAQWSDNREG
jgi:serine/threonine protein phosphatase PrpC